MNYLPIHKRLLRIAALFLFICNQTYVEAEVKAKYPEFEGKIIRNVIVKLKDIFDDNEEGFIYRQANSLKINTKEKVIKREVLLKEGSVFNQSLLEQSERNLRSFRYLRKVNITPVAVENDFVDLIVNTQDTWTIIPQLGFSTGTGRDKFSAGMVEHNLLGYGKRVAARFEDEDNRRSVAAQYEDQRFFGTQHTFSGGFYDRNDGEVGYLTVGRPYRSYSQRFSYSFTAYAGDTIGRLFENNDERFIFRQENVHLTSRFSVSSGNPEIEIHRLAFGYDYLSDSFDQATLEDYEDLNLDPELVSNDPELLASSRRYTGPSLTYHYIEPKFISRNYIDRFDRVEDYNLGVEYSVNSLLAPRVLGSIGDTYLFSANRSQGHKLSADSFMRGELGFASRFDSDGMANTLYRGEFKYYNVLGAKYIKDRFIGRHTLAFSFYVDYADKLDKDREFLIGGDNAIRGYEAKMLTGDKRLAINLEDRVHLIDDAFKLVSIGAAAFFDGGGATNESLGNIITDEFYSNVGVGLRIAFPRSTGSQVLRVDLSFPLRDGPDGSGQFEPRLLISGGQIFDSHLRSENLGTERANVDIGFDR